MVGRRAGTISRINAVKWLKATAKRFRPRAQGCFNPGSIAKHSANRNAVASHRDVTRATKQVKKDCRTSDATALRLRETLCDSPRVEAILGFGTEPRCGIFGEAFSQNTKSIAISDQKPSSPIKWVFIIRGAPQTQNALLQRFG